MRLKYIPANGAPLAAARSIWIAKPTPKRNENIARNFPETRKYIQNPQHGLVEAAGIEVDRPAAPQRQRGGEDEQVEHNDPQQGEPAEDVHLGDPLGRPDRAELGRGWGRGCNL